MRLLLVDDHVMFRQGLKFLLSDLDESLQFMESGSCEKAADLLAHEVFDLILLDQETLVFTEVRWRKHQSYGGALASVDQHKQRRLINAAQHFLARHPEHHHRPCRFDVLGMEPDSQQAVLYQWIQNAFYSE